MGNLLECAQKARQQLQNGFRRIFPKVQTTLKKPRPNIGQPQLASPPILPIPQQGLSINVTIRFETPLTEVITKSYATTASLNINQELVNALTGRIGHCTNEMITRSDADADRALRHTHPRVKPARYHILYQVLHDGQPIWDRYFTSYQHTAVTRESTADIVVEVDRIVAMFLITHDAGFKWRVPQPNGVHPHAHKTTAPEVGKPQNTHCIPTLNEPAYTINLAMRTKFGGRDAFRSFKVDSQQSTPLTLQLGEDMMSQLSSVIRNAVEDRESKFWEVHNDCDGLEGTYGCPHIEDGAFELFIKVQNNLGPDYGHLADRVVSHRHLVSPQEAAQFLKDLKLQARMVRGHFDTLTLAAEDLVVSVRDLRSYNWMINDPFKIIIDNSACRDRVTTEKILQRLKTGMFDVLKGHGTAAFVTAHKRGHLVLETTICRGEDVAFWDMGMFENLDLKKKVLQRRLRDRITKDLAAVCKDTIRLDPADSMVGIKVLIPEKVDVVALTKEAEIRQNRFQRIADRSIKHHSRLQQPEEQLNVLGLRDLGEAMGSIATSAPRPMPNTTFYKKIHVANQEAVHTPQTPRSSVDFDDVARDTPSPSPLPRQTPIPGPRTPSPSQSTRESVDDGARTPPTPEGGFLSINPMRLFSAENVVPRTSPTPECGLTSIDPARLLLPKDNGPRTPPTPEGGLTTITQGNWIAEDDGGRTPPSPEESSALFSITPLPFIQEEDEECEGNSQQTIVRTPQRRKENATALLASMTADNLRASDIPNFTATRVYIDEEKTDMFPDEDPERTLTPRMFRIAECNGLGHGGSQNTLDHCDSGEICRTTPSAPSIAAPTGSAGSAETVSLNRLTGKTGLKEELEETRSCDITAGKDALHSGESWDEIDATIQSWADKRMAVGVPDEFLGRCEDRQGARASSGETAAEFSEESEQRAHDFESSAGLQGVSPTLRSSQSSEAIRVFPRRRSDQSSVVFLGNGTSGNPHGRHMTCPVNQRISPHEE